MPATAAATRSAGNPLPGPDDSLPVPPADTGDALGLGPSRLTVTFGFGPSLFEGLGLESRRPSGLRELPAFPREELQTTRSGGDLCVQACADDGLVA